MPKDDDTQLTPVLAK